MKSLGLHLKVRKKCFVLASAPKVTCWKHDDTNRAWVIVRCSQGCTFLQCVLFTASLQRFVVQPDVSGFVEVLQKLRRSCRENVAQEQVQVQNWTACSMTFHQYHYWDIFNLMIQAMVDITVNSSLFTFVGNMELFSFLTRSPCLWRSSNWKRKAKVSNAANACLLVFCEASKAIVTACRSEVKILTNLLCCVARLMSLFFSALVTFCQSRLDSKSDCICSGLTHFFMVFRELVSISLLSPFRKKDKRIN